MLKEYKLIKKYPSLPKDWEVGMIVGLGDRPALYSPCHGKYSNKYLSDQEVENQTEYWELIVEKDYNIYKDPVTDDGTKKSLKGLCSVVCAEGEYYVKEECTPEEEADTQYNELHTIYEDGKFYNQVSLTEIRKRLNLI